MASEPVDQTEARKPCGDPGVAYCLACGAQRPLATALAAPACCEITTATYACSCDPDVPDSCAATECIVCGVLHCGDPLHYHHDACPKCEGGK